MNAISKISCKLSILVIDSTLAEILGPSQTGGSCHFIKHGDHFESSFMLRLQIQIQFINK